MHPILCHLGNAAIYSYGVIIAIGVLLGFRIGLKLARERGIDPLKMQSG